MYINMRNYVHVFDCPQNVQPLSRLGFSGTSGWPFHRSIVPRSPGAEEPRSRKLAMQHAQEVVSRLDGSPTFSDLPWKLRLTDFSSANGKSPVQIRPFPSGWSRFRQHFIKVVPNQDWLDAENAGSQREEWISWFAVREFRGAAKTLWIA